MVGRTLRFVFGSPQAARPQEEVPSSRGSKPEIEFSAYAEDSRIFGRLRLDGERLTDMLNLFSEFVLIDAMVESLANGCAYEVPELVIARDELLAIEASGPRGNPGRRVRVRPYPVGAKLGTYLLRGYLHVTPGADPMLAVRRKRPIVPLTDATIEYQIAGVRTQRRSSTILFNRELADWILPTVDEAIEYPDIPIDKNQGPLTKDFTGEILLSPLNDTRLLLVLAAAVLLGQPRHVCRWSRDVPWVRLRPWAVRRRRSVRPLLLLELRRVASLV